MYDCNENFVCTKCKNLVQTKNPDIFDIYYKISKLNEYSKPNDWLYVKNDTIAYYYYVRAQIKENLNYFVNYTICDNILHKVKPYMYCDNPDIIKYASLIYVFIGLYANKHKLSQKRLDILKTYSKP